MLYTAESAQFNSPFSPTTISSTPRFRQKREVWLPFFAEHAQNDLKTHNYEDNAKFHSAFLPTTLSYASRFRRNRGVIENFEYLDEFEEDFWKCWLYCVLSLLVIERCKNMFKNRLRKSRACVPLRCCGNIPVQSFGSHIRPQPPGLGVKEQEEYKKSGRYYCTSQ